MCRFVVSLCVLGTAAFASAQDHAGAIYVNAGVSVPRQPVVVGAPPPFPAPFGTTVSWLAGGGVFLAPRISAEVDVSRTGVMRSRRTGRSGTNEMGWRQDRFVSIGVKGHLPLRPEVRVEPIAGLVLIRSEGSSSSFSGDVRGDLEPAWNPGLMFGADLRLGGGRIALLPGMRFLFTGVPEGTTCYIRFSGAPLCSAGQPLWPHKYPRWTQRPSLSVAVNF